MEYTSKSRSEKDGWTNERHLQFLNSMEASFIQTMLENQGWILRPNCNLLDASDSASLGQNTIDKGRPGRGHSTSSDAVIMDPRGQRTGQRTRRPISRPYISSQDQVVPQWENYKDHPHPE